MPLDMTPSDPYDTPDTNPDPYDSTTTTTAANGGLPAHIDPSTLPSGLPILGPLTGFTAARRAQNVQTYLAHVSQTVRRPLTQTEQTALAYHTAKGLSIASWGAPLGIAAGAYRTYTTRADFRWPFYGKLVREAAVVEGEAARGFWDGQKMWVGEKEVLRGLSSQAKANMLHYSRGFAYCLLGAFFMPFFVSSYAATVSQVGELRDPRLQVLNQGLKEAWTENQKETREQMQRREKLEGYLNGRKRAESAKQQTGAFRIPAFPGDGEQTTGRRGGGGGGGVPEVDDASPTGGAGLMMDMDVDDGQGRLSGPRDMGGVLSDGQMRTAEAKARPPPNNNNNNNNRASTYQMEKVERQPKDFGSDFDDDNNNASGGDNGSVWERIRQQSSASEPSSSGSYTGSRTRGRNSSGGGGDTQQQQQEEGSTLGDSFSFSNSEEERSFAKDEAQREFDERVERERRGGEFSSSSGGGGRRGW